MSSGFVLILVLWGGQGMSVTTQKFANEKYCQQAGDAAVQMMKGAWPGVRYTCVPAGAMTQTEILATLHRIVANHQEYTTWTVSTPHLVMLVNKAVEAEREACAKVCDVIDDGREDLSAKCAAAIRARSNT